MRKAFTLIEVMVVMAVLAVLAVIIIGAITAARRTQELTVRRANAETIISGLESYYSKRKVYCDSTSSLTCGVASFEEIKEDLETEGIGVKLQKTNCDTITNSIIFSSAYAAQNQFTNWEGGGKVDLKSKTITVMIAPEDCEGSEYAEIFAEY